MAVVFLGIGSNLGNKKANCLTAIDKLLAGGSEVVKISSPYDSKPWGVTDQPDFVNMAVEARTTMSPRELLDALKKIETDMGREPGQRWGPRLIDLDLLLYDDLIIQSDDLVVPHPLLHERDFVLMPLSEIAPDLVHPVIGKKIVELKEKLCNETDHFSEQQIQD
ncbi:MAG TPA: 2-amino-4-hydroxy-6-hydroxymethyldihydropteridine diphosphokinase [Dissulfurispiraceae bacterium]|nr:2-amino-4-hydroxy-6-hydroxymethyldihydropteridine diphosphokinase [Dissulfurispiraceae bacterium]